MRKIGILLTLLVAIPACMFGQGARNIRISEVLVNNSVSLQDEFGHHDAWLELENTAFSTYNVRGMYITTDRKTLDQSLSAPDRIRLMHIIPSGDSRTIMSARQHLVLYLNSNPKRGTIHLSVPVDSLGANWVALFDGNGIDLIDSVSVPRLAVNESYALHKVERGKYAWTVMEPDMVTPGIDNDQSATESKAARLKRDDPYGFGITVLSMGIVFFCLALLFVFFSLFGRFMARKSDMQKAQEIISRQAATIEAAQKAEAAFKSRQSNVANKEIYLAVIAMALKQYQDDAHDIESGIITINPKHSKWTRI